MQDVADLLENRLGHRRQRHRRNIRMAERENAGAEMKMPAVIGSSEAELRERIKATPHRGAREAGLGADLRNREFALPFREGLNHGESARQRRTRLVFWGLAQAEASAARLVDLADVVYPGHDRPFRVADGQTEYLSAFSFTLTGVARDDPGLRAEPAAPFTGPEDLTAPADGARR